MKSLFYLICLIKLTMLSYALRTLVRRKLNVQPLASAKLSARAKKGDSTVDGGQDEGKVLVIVESPAKAKTIQKLVGSSSKYIIDSCAGHICDLAKDADDLPKGMVNDFVQPQLRIKISDLGVDVFNNFQPIYKIIPGKHEIVRRLKKSAQGVSRILLATDEDREGEAISWHLVDVIKPTVPYQRAVFHEITQSAIEKAFAEPREIDYHLVQAQESRRILDKLTGFTLSPLLWRFVSTGLSAGRVQSCGLHIITEKEKTRWAFKPSKYYSITALFEAELPSPSSPKKRQKSSSNNLLLLPAKLHTWDDMIVANEKDFDGLSGEVKQQEDKRSLIVLNESLALSVMQWLSAANSSSSSSVPVPTFWIGEKTSKTLYRSPAVPFITSTLQQEASRKLGFSPSRTMSIAQQLYESGHITYMRTDSPTLSTQALNITQSMVNSQYGAGSLDNFSSSSDGGDDGEGDGSKKKRKKAAVVSPKNAQEAHEAIRPADNQGKFLTTQQLANKQPAYTEDFLTLYDLILRRTLASQMKASRSVTTTLTIYAAAGAGHAANQQGQVEDDAARAIFRCSETIVHDPGYLACLEENKYRGYSYHKEGGLPEGVYSQLMVNQRIRLCQDAQVALQFAQRGTTALQSQSHLKKQQELAMMAEVADNGEAVETEELATMDDDQPAESASNSVLFFPALKSSEHITRAPSRYTEASFIKQLETLGVGRPSTYSKILQILKERQYILIERQTIIPTGFGLIVDQFLQEYFPEIVQETFTAQMEEGLDEIAKGKLEKEVFLRQVYLGDNKLPTAKQTGQQHGQPAKHQMVGLLTKINHLLTSNSIDGAKSRSMSLPYLADLGQLSIMKGGLFFDFWSQQPQPSASPQSGLAATTVMTTIRRKLPQQFQDDYRTITKESLLEMIGGGSSHQQLGGDGGRADGSYYSGDGLMYIAPEGIELGYDPDQPNHRILWKSGPFGRYLQVEILPTTSSSTADDDDDDETGAEDSKKKMKTTRKSSKTAAATTVADQQKAAKKPKKNKTINKSIPQWITDIQTFTLPIALEYLRLPNLTKLGIFPLTNTPMVLDLYQGKVRITAAKHPFQAEVPDGLYLHELTHEIAVEILTAAEIPNMSAKTLIGYWRCPKEGIVQADTGAGTAAEADYDLHEIVLLQGRFGPYITSNKINVSLGKRDPESITEEIAQEMLEKKLVQGPGRRGRFAKKGTTKKATKTSKASKVKAVKVDKPVKKTTTKAASSSSTDTNSVTKVTKASAKSKAKAKPKKEKVVKASSSKASAAGAAVAVGGDDDQVQKKETPTVSKVAAKKVKVAGKKSAKDDEVAASEGETTTSEDKVTKRNSRTTKKSVAILEENPTATISR